MKFKIRTFLILIIVLTYSLSKGQIGGNSSYEFLNIANSARISALGGDFISVKDDDPTILYCNPSLLNKSFNNNLSLSFTDYFADINLGVVSYTRNFSKLGTFAATIQFIDYGKFTRTDQNTVDETYGSLGDFRAGDYSLGISWGRPLDSSFTIGANLKTIYSSLETYSSFALAVDVAGSYFSKDKYFSVSLIAKNIGRELKSYIAENNQPLPFDMQLALSKRFQYVPFRVFLIYDHIEKFNLTYNDPYNPDPSTDQLTGEKVYKSNLSKYTDELMRHFILGLEFVPVKTFNIQFGYNYRRRQELKVDSRPATAGFSFGLGIKVSKFKFNYSRSIFNVAGATNNFSLSTNFK